MTEIEKNPQLHCYSIGHSNHPIEEFINLLKKYQINALIDVRTYPFSKYQPQFNQENLENFLKTKNISYLFLGNFLGGKYNDPKYQFPDGIVDYNKVKERPEFKEGIQKVEQLIKDGKHPALMCTEKDPLDCHRFLLISRVLSRDGIFVDHLLSNGDLISQKLMETRLRDFYHNSLNETIESLFERRNRDLFINKSEKDQINNKKRVPETVTFSKYSVDTSDNNANLLKIQKDRQSESNSPVRETMPAYREQNEIREEIVSMNRKNADSSILKENIEDRKTVRLFTIGFTQKSAQKFFESLLNNHVNLLIDVRLNNKSQLAGFTKADDLKYFLKKICGIEYLHMPLCAPSEELLKKYQKKEIKWPEYESQYIDILKKREVQIKFNKSNLNSACFLCSEPKPDQCHRRLLAEYLKQQFSDIEIIHL